MSKTQSKKAWKNLVSGGTAGAIEATIMYPTEFVKTQLQLEARAVKTGGQPRYSGVFDCARKTVAERGVLGLYRGLSTLVIGSIPKAAVRFAAFNQFKQLLADENGKLSSLRTMAAGMGAGMSEAVIAVTPMETVKTKLIHDQNSANPKYRGLAHGVRTIVAEEGIGGVYRGLAPTMFKQGLNQATRFTIYNFLKSNLLSYTQQKDLQLYQSLACGSFAGFVSVYVTMPLDVVKTRMQGLEASKYRGSVHCFSSIVKNEGVLALWKGTTPRLGRVCFSGGIIFAAYEQVMGVLNVVSPEHD
eukprot:TRINITY_DN66181_c4_g4_i1.p1 TRINITY_DN66181_c4_g4~~TRINITY_DN66181_c4_g4_i1.p1  ORF type:complete len:301 (+),score=159.15 TRINITY_DN66181_c4_g4_i1:290-1192(+)